MEFAIQLPTDAEGQGHWVLAVDPVGERLLLAGEDKTMQWVPVKDCKFLKARNPDMPQPVIAVQPQAQPTLALPSLRLNGGRR